MNIKVTKQMISIPRQVVHSEVLRYHQSVTSEVWRQKSSQMKPSYFAPWLHRTLCLSARRTSVSCRISVTSSPASEARPSCWTPEPTDCRSGQARLSDRTSTYTETTKGLENGFSFTLH